jgi:uncharacterized membrane protein YkvA (DUF1232 family)
MKHQGASRHYSDHAYGKKIRRLQGPATRSVLERASILYHLLKSGTLPVWARLLIIAALGYFVWPMDAVPDPLPGVGYADDLLFMGLVLMQLGDYISEEQAPKSPKSTRSAPSGSSSIKS